MNYRCFVQRFHEDIINSNGEALINFCDQNTLGIDDPFFAHKPEHKYTCSNPQGHKFTIEYIITNRAIQPKQILYVRAHIGSNPILVLKKIDVKIQYSTDQIHRED